MPYFTRYIGIDYSGAQTPKSSLPGLRIYQSMQGGSPVEILPPPSPRKYWTRQAIAAWLLDKLAGWPPTLVGIDHGFSFPARYFETHHLPPDWDVFLEDFCHHWPTDHPLTYVQCIRDGCFGNGAARWGNARWRRITEKHCRSAKSVFHFDVQGSVAKSTHAGIPWLRSLRRELCERLHFWPFDGWEPPLGRSVIAEVYPSLWSKTFPREERTPDQHDAYSIVRWMCESDASGLLESQFAPPLEPSERKTAEYEGWILGVPAAGVSDSDEGASAGNLF